MDIGWTRRSVLIAAIGALPLAAVACRPGRAADEPAFPVSRLIIETQRGRFPFMVEVAETPSTWQLGLMHRQSLAADAGMLFDYHHPRPVAMWMKDTLIPLDMVFIDQKGVVSSVAENTQPLSLATINSTGPVLAVLEVNAGTAARLGIRPGDRIHHPMFEPAASETAPR